MIPPNVTAIVGTIACFAVGTMVYCGADVRATKGDAVVRVYVAPVDETVCVAPMGSAEPNVTVRAACLLSVTTEPPELPLLTTVHVGTAVGNAKIASAATVTATVVRVETKVNVSVVALALAVTVAPITLLELNVESSVAAAVVASVTSALVVAPDANAPKFPLIAEFELPNSNDVRVALDATSA